MLETINKYLKKGWYIGIYPIYEKKTYQWVAFIMIGGKNHWLKGDKECSMSAFKSPENAYKAIIDYCENIKIK